MRVMKQGDRLVLDIYDYDYGWFNMHAVPTEFAGHVGWRKPAEFVDRIRVYRDGRIEILSVHRARSAWNQGVLRVVEKEDHPKLLEQLPDWVRARIVAWWEGVA